jgi:spectinomycin phosphotransferase/16S rRNA (guanine(1405)-N(7))-methyltransferase
LPSGGAAITGKCAAATGITPLPELIELYRLGWDVKDMAYDAARFFRPHSDSADDVKSWELLSSLVRRAGQ